MGLHPRILFTVFVILLSAYAVISSRNWPLGSRIFPWTIGITMLVLGAVQLGVELYQSFRGKNQQSGKKETGDLVVDYDMSKSEVAIRAMNFFYWTLSFFALIWLLGFLIAVPVFALSYLKIEARAGWPFSLSTAISCLLLLLLVFELILHLPWPEPVIPWPEMLLRRLVPWI